jgi:hypothetical protein
MEYRLNAASYQSLSLDLVLMLSFSVGLGIFACGVVGITFFFVATLLTPELVKGNLPHPPFYGKNTGNVTILGCSWLNSTAACVRIPVCYYS